MEKQNNNRENDPLAQCAADCLVREQTHFYQVGSAEELRYPMIEALVIRAEYVADSLPTPRRRVPPQQETLFDGEP